MNEKGVLMKLVKAGGVCVLALSVTLDGKKHVEAPIYLGEPMPSSPFVLISTLSGNSATLSFSYPQPSHIPV
jgi:hypothetical protein